LRFVTTRGVLRCLIARYTGMAARDVSFGYGPCGKPFLPEAGSCALRFNVSHSGGHSLLAFTTGRDIGVDVQRESSELSFMPIAERSFSAAEMASLLALKDSARVSAFFRGWVRKEAYVKGTGAGLSVPLNSFEVTADPDDPTLLSVVDEGLVGSRWRLMDLESVPGFASALAIDAPDVRISQNICNIHDFADEIEL
jgi:4'-phosphopantetheinyl transferase